MYAELTGESNSSPAPSVVLLAPGGITGNVVISCEGAVDPRGGMVCCVRVLDSSCKVYRFVPLKCELAGHIPVRIARSPTVATCRGPLPAGCAILALTAQDPDDDFVSLHILSAP